MCGIENYSYWNTIPLGGGCGYTNTSINPEQNQPLVPSRPYPLGDPYYDICWVDSVQGLKNALNAHPNNLSQYIIVFRSLSPSNYAPEINFSGELSPILIPAYTTLFGYRGYLTCTGALLYNTDTTVTAMFQTSGSGVIFSGLRIAGVDLVNPVYTPYTTLTCGIKTIYSSLEVKNCELFGWPHTPLRIDGSYDPINPISNIYIHHNYIHHNQRADDVGYGMAISYCKAIIEANILNYNRHSIEGGGEPGTSYEARYNLHLNNVVSHAFDMHAWPRPNTPKNISGETIYIHHNSFFLWKHQAIGLDWPSAGMHAISQNFFQVIFQNFFAGYFWSTYQNSPNIPTSNNDYINPTHGSDADQPCPPNMNIQDNQYGVPP